MCYIGRRKKRALWKIDQKYLMWCWRSMRQINWADRVRNEEMLRIVKEERGFLHTMKWRNANWIGHTLLRNCLIKHVIERRIDGTRRRGKRSKLLLGDLKKNRRYWNLYETALDCTLWTELALEEATDCRSTEVVVVVAAAKVVVVVMMMMMMMMMIMSIASR